MKDYKSAGLTAIVANLSRFPQLIQSIGLIFNHEEPMVKPFHKDLEDLINVHCLENESNTPDFILAEYILCCLRNYNDATKKRDEWYDVKLEPGCSK